MQLVVLKMSPKVTPFRHLSCL